MNSEELLSLAAGNATSAAGAIKDGKIEKAIGRLWDAMEQAERASGMTPPIIIRGETARMLRQDLGKG